MSILSVAESLAKNSPAAGWFNPNLETVIRGVHPGNDDDPLHGDATFQSLAPKGRLTVIQVPSNYTSVWLEAAPYLADKIGQSGWNHKDKTIEYVVIEFDLADEHAGGGCSPEDLATIIMALDSIPCAEVRRSTGGNGLHIRVPLIPHSAPNGRKDYVATIQHVLDLLDLLHSLPFTLRSKVDPQALGRGVLWLWALKSKPDSFKLLSEATEKLDLGDWKPVHKPKQNSRGFDGFGMPDFLTTNGVKFTTKPFDRADDGNGYLVKCPFGPHEGDDTKTMCWTEIGVPHYKCLAAKCSKKRWRDFAKAVAPDDPTAIPSPSTAAVLKINYLARRDDTFFNCDNEAYVTVTYQNQKETCRVGSEFYKDVLRLRYLKKVGSSITDANLKQAIADLSAHARLHCDERAIALRVASDGFRHYIDLCNDARQAIEIAPQGWKVIDSPNVKFIRPAKFLAMPKPSESNIELLWRYVHVEIEDRPLILAWLVGALNSEIACMLLALAGEAGSGKSLTACMLGALIAPVSGQQGTFFSPIHRLNSPKDLFVAAKNSRLVAIDNLSAINQDLSDALCCVVSGSADESRKLYSDNAESRFLVRRPVVVTSRAHIVDESDLADRTIAIELPQLNDRKSESELWQSFVHDRPAILGALLDAYVAGLKSWQQESISDPPRMYDFALFAQAAESVFGFTKGTTVAAIKRTQRELAKTAVNSSPLASAILKFVDAEPFEGLATDLIDALGEPDGWPTSPRKFANQFAKVVTDLRALGVRAEKRRAKGRTVWSIKKAA